MKVHACMDGHVVAVVLQRGGVVEIIGAESAYDFLWGVHVS